MKNQTLFSSKDKFSNKLKLLLQLLLCALRVNKADFYCNIRQTCLTFNRLSLSETFVSQSTPFIISTYNLVKFPIFLTFQLLFSERNNKSN